MLRSLYTDAATAGNHRVSRKGDMASGQWLMQTPDCSLSLGEQQNSVSLGRSLF